MYVVFSSAFKAHGNSSLEEINQNPTGKGILGNRSFLYTRAIHSCLIKSHEIVFQRSTMDCLQLSWFQLTVEEIEVKSNFCVTERGF